MKIKRKALSLLLTVVMVLNMGVTSVFAIAVDDSNVPVEANSSDMASLNTEPVSDFVIENGILTKYNGLGGQ